MDFYGRDELLGGQALGGMVMTSDNQRISCKSEHEYKMRIQCGTILAAEVDALGFYQRMQ